MACFKMGEPTVPPKAKPDGLYPLPYFFINLLLIFFIKLNPPFIAYIFIKLNPLFIAYIFLFFNKLRRGHRGT